MTHRAGLAYGFTSIGPIAYAHQRALGDVLASNMSVDAWLAALGSLPLSYPPGDRFHYSHATDVLGFLVGRISGMDFREFLFKRIFEPLGRQTQVPRSTSEDAADGDDGLPAEGRSRWRAGSLRRSRRTMYRCLLRRWRRVDPRARRLSEVRPHAAGER